MSSKKKAFTFIIVKPSERSPALLSRCCATWGTPEYMCVGVILRKVFSTPDKCGDIHKIREELAREYNGEFDEELFWRCVERIEGILTQERETLASSFLPGYPGGLPG